MGPSRPQGPHRRVRTAGYNFGHRDRTAASIDGHASSARRRPQGSRGRSVSGPASRIQDRVAERALQTEDDAVLAPVAKLLDVDG